MSPYRVHKQWLQVHEADVPIAGALRDRVPMKMGPLIATQRTPFEYFQINCDLLLSMLIAGTGS